MYGNVQENDEDAHAHELREGEADEKVEQGSLGMQRVRVIKMNRKKSGVDLLLFVKQTRRSQTTDRSADSYRPGVCP
jgi:hypothetical protein